MILSMSRQAILFLMTVGVGMVLGLVYDIFRILRKTVPHPPLVVQLEDLLYWVSVTLLMFYFMLNENAGEIRFFSILGNLLGMVLYFATISLLIMKVSVAVVEFVQKVIRTVCRLLLMPLKWLFIQLKPLFKFLQKKTRKGLHSVKRYAKMKSVKARRNRLIMKKKM